MMSFRFLHAADIHLDSPVSGLNGYPSVNVVRFRTATREAFDRLVETAIRERVDFVVIAGDLYDGDWRDYSTGLYFVSRMARLHQAGIPVYLLHGNHDAESVITRRLELPPNVHVFGAEEPETFELHELAVALHGQSFAERAVLDNLVPGYPAPVTGAFNIGVLHTALGGMGGHERYAPCSLSDLTTKGYDYWALGHVHQGQVLHERPHVVFPGNLQGRHIRETGPKGAVLVTVREQEVTDIESLALDVVRWSVVRIAVGDAATPAQVNDRIRAGLAASVEAEADGRLLVSRVVLEGSTELHARLLASHEHLLADARAAALALGDAVAWVEKVVVETDPATVSTPAESMADLSQLLANAVGDEDLIARLDSDFGELVRRLPHKIRSDAADPMLACAVEGDYAALLERICPHLTAHLSIG